MKNAVACLALALCAVACRKGPSATATPSASPSPLPSQGATGKNRDSLDDMLGPDPGRCVDGVEVNADNICFRLNRGGYWCRGARMFDEAPHRLIPRAYRKLFLDGPPFCGMREDQRIECWGRNERVKPWSGKPYSFIESPDSMVKSPAPLRATPGPVEAFASRHGEYCVQVGGQLDCPSVLGPEPTIQGLGPFRWWGIGNGFGCAASEQQLWCWGLWVRLHPPPRAASDKLARPLKLPEELRIRELHVAGGSAGCLLAEDGSVHCFGDARVGEWGDGQRTACGAMTGEGCEPARRLHAVATLGHEVKELGFTGTGACALKKDGTVWCWGENLAHLVAPTPDAGTPATDEPLPLLRRDLGADNRHLVVGRRFACVKKSNGAWWCWGDNRMQQVADTRNAFEPPRELPFPAPRCRAQ